MSNSLGRLCVTNYIYGDPAEAAKYLSTVAHYKNELKKIYGQTNPNMNYWRQLSDTAKVHLSLVNGQPQAFIYAGQQKIYVTLLDIYRTDMHLRYEKFDKQDAKENYPSGTSGWFGKNKAVISYDQQTDGRSYNRFRVYVKGVGGANILESLTAKVITACRLGDKIIVITKDLGSYLVKIKTIQLAPTGIFFIDNIDNPFTLPALNANLGTGSYWLFSEFSPDSKTLCIYSKVMSDSTHQEVNILTFSGDYTEYTCALVYNKAITTVSVTTTDVTSSTWHSDLDAWLGTRTISVSSVLHKEEPYLLALRAEDTGFCALRQQVDSYAYSVSEVQRNDFPNNGITSSSSLSSVNSLDVIRIDSTGYSVEYAKELPEYHNNTSYHSDDSAVNNTKSANVLDTATQITYYSSKNKSILYKNHLTSTIEVTDGGTITNGFGSVFPRTTNTDTEQESALYARDVTSTLIAEKSYATPLYYRYVDTRSFGIGAPSSTTQTATTIKMIDLAWTQNPRWGYIPGHYEVKSAYNDDVVLYCFNLLYPLSGAAVGPFGYTVALEVKTGEHTLINERLDLVSSSPLTYTPISITN